MRMTGEDSETLHLTSLERESTGAYLCSASNTEGETRSSSLYLKVQCKYRFEEKTFYFCFKKSTTRQIYFTFLFLHIFIFPRVYRFYAQIEA